MHRSGLTGHVWLLLLQIGRQAGSRTHGVHRLYSWQIIPSAGTWYYNMWHVLRISFKNGITLCPLCDCFSSIIWSTWEHPLSSGGYIHLILVDPPLHKLKGSIPAGECTLWWNPAFCLAVRWDKHGALSSLIFDLLYTLILMNFYALFSLATCLLLNLWTSCSFFLSLFQVFILMSFACGIWMHMFIYA